MDVVEVPKLSWRLKELPPVTGLSEPFWRKMVRLKKVKFRRVEGAILILDRDLRQFLEGRKEEGAKQQAESQTASAAA